MSLPSTDRSIPPQALLMLFADARVPSGGHAYSAGMEPALSGGLRPADVPAYLVGKARTTSIVDAGTAVSGMNAASGYRPAEALAEVDAAWAARTPSPVQRAASRQAGRGYLRVVTRLWGPHPAVSALSRFPTPPCRPVVLGVAAAAAGWSAEELARLSVYDDAQTAVSALLKIDPLDPLVATTWVLDACAAAEDLLAEAIAAIRPDAIPAFSSPQSEDWAEAHALLSQRLFHA